MPLRRLAGLRCARISSAPVIRHKERATRSELQGAHAPEQPAHALHPRRLVVDRSSGLMSPGLIAWAERGEVRAATHQAWFGLLGLARGDERCHSAGLLARVAVLALSEVGSTTGRWSGLVLTRTWVPRTRVARAWIATTVPVSWGDGARRRAVVGAVPMLRASPARGRPWRHVAGGMCAGVHGNLPTAG